jgi:cell division protein FtsA
MASNIIVGLDVGTTKVCSVVAETNGKGTQIRGVGTTASVGLRKGMIINIDSTVESIRQAVRKGESYSGTKIKSVTVGISGSHIKGFYSSGIAGVRGKDVQAADIERAVDSARAVYIPLDREVLHVIPTEFVLDEQEGITDPIGMTGVRLEAKVHIITGAISPIQNLIKCCQKAGLHITDIVLEPLASACATLTSDEKEYGVVLIDIGGGTTDIALFKDGKLRHISVLGIGGSHLTNDIAIGFRIHMQEAERLKKKYGSAFEDIFQGGTEEIKIRQTGEQERIIPRKYLVEITHPRCIEMFEMIREEIESCFGYELATCGVVLTGGCSLLNGMEKLAEAVLGLPVRIGSPSHVKGQASFAQNPVYSCGVGLMTCAAESDSNRIFLPEVFSDVFGIMKDWVKGVFR